MTKYVLANVEIPIKIDQDGNVESLHSYAQIHVLKKINDPKEIVKNLPSVHEQIEKLFSKKEDNNNEETQEKKTKQEDEEMIVLKNEIKTENKSLKNTSFKNRKHFKHNVSMKHQKN